MAYIYVVSATNSYIKIGECKLPYERFGSLIQSSPLHLRLEYLCECDNAFDIEQAVHKRLAQHHVHHEWFDVELVTAIETIRAEIKKHWQLKSIAPRSEKKIGRAILHRAAINEIAS